MRDVRPARAIATLALLVRLAWPEARPLEAAEPASGPVFEIGLAVDADSLVVEPVEAVTLSWPDADGGVRTAALNERVRLRASGTQLLVEPLGRPRAVPLALLRASDTLWIGDARLEDGAKPGLRWNGGTWRGRFKVFFSPRGRLTLVTRLGLEPYLLGVVPGEIGALSDSLLEAGRAQAVAARSYSLFYRGRRGMEGFDLHASVEDQLYSPVERERPLATRSVETTRGLVSMSGDRPIRANYCSTCGGVTADVWEAWPAEPVDYLRGRADRGGTEGDHCSMSPQYRWREEWSVAEFLSTLARFAPAQGVALPAGGVGNLVDVDVLRRSRSGRVWTLRVRTTTGDVVIPAYVLRQVLRRPGRSGSILRSNLFKIAVRRDAAGRPASVVVSGAGSGHGVGLCQTGALAMARGGALAGQILGHYYAGSSLVKLW